MLFAREELSGAASPASVRAALGRCWGCVGVGSHVGSGESAAPPAGRHREEVTERQEEAVALSSLHSQEPQSAQDCSQGRLLQHISRVEGFSPTLT